MTEAWSGAAQAKREGPSTLTTGSILKVRDRDGGRLGREGAERRRDSEEGRIFRGRQHRERRGKSGYGGAQAGSYR
jgi:hypothetical protein